MKLINTYIGITKPGIIRGNVMTAAAGFLLASQGSLDSGLFVALVAGTSLVIASACVFNNYLDRNIDKKMDRTKRRALVTGEISVQQALVYATVLSGAGFGILAFYTNAITTLLGVVAIFSYVVLYGLAKRHSTYGTLVGSLPGALSLTAGYTAVTGQLDSGALLLFLIMVVWQMPHFYAIATYRLKDYKAAGLPVLTVVKGVPRAKKSIVAYVAAYGVVSSLLFFYGYTGYTYLLVMVCVSLYWLKIAYGGFTAKDDIKWAHKVFGFSLVVLLTFSVMISLEAWLP